MNQRDEDNGPHYLDYVIILLLKAVVLVLVLHFLTPRQPTIFSGVMNDL